MVQSGGTGGGESIGRWELHFWVKFLYLWRVPGPVRRYGTGDSAVSPLEDAIPRHKLDM